MLKRRNSLQQSLCPVVICPYLCSSAGRLEGHLESRSRKEIPKSLFKTSGDHLLLQDLSRLSTEPSSGLRSLSRMPEISSRLTSHNSNNNNNNDNKTNKSNNNNNSNNSNSNSNSNSNRNIIMITIVVITRVVIVILVIVIVIVI